MRQIVNIVIENDGYLVRKGDSDDKFIRVMPQGILRIPCIPFYQSAWMSMGGDVRPAVSDLVEKVSLLYGPVSKCNIMAACPADAMPTDYIMLKNTFEYAGFKKIKLISKTSLGAALKATDYIAISTSERLLILEWYRDGVVAESKYYNKAAVSRKKLLNDIDSIRQRNDFSLRILIFDGCNELAGLYDLGEVVDADKMSELLDIMSDVHYKKKKLEDLIGGLVQDSGEVADDTTPMVENVIVFGEDEDMVSDGIGERTKDAHDGTAVIEDFKKDNEPGDEKKPEADNGSDDEKKPEADNESDDEKKPEET